MRAITGSLRNSRLILLGCRATNLLTNLVTYIAFTNSLSGKSCSLTAPAKQDFKAHSTAQTSHVVGASPKPVFQKHSSLIEPACRQRSQRISVQSRDRHSPFYSSPRTAKTPQ